VNLEKHLGLFKKHLHVFWKTLWSFHANKMIWGAKSTEKPQINICSPLVASKLTTEWGYQSVAFLYFQMTFNGKIKALILQRYQNNR